MGKTGKGKITTVYKNRDYRELYMRLLAVLLSFAGTCALPWILKMDKGALGFTNSILSVFVFLSLYVLMNRVLKVSFGGRKRKWILPIFFGSAFSFCMVAGAQLDEKGSVPFTNLSMWIAILIGTVIMTLTLRYFWECLAVQQKAGNVWDGSFAKWQEKNRNRNRNRNTVSKRSDWLLPAVLIFIMYLPVFLAVYPGFFVYDAQDELTQVMTRSFSTHHPLAHVLLLGGGNSTGA